MKNIIISLMCLFILTPQAFAAKLVVEALEEYNSQYPPKEYSVKIVEDTTLGNSIILKKGSIIKGKIIENIEPKRLKRDAYFVFLGESILEPGKCTTKDIFPGIQAKMHPYNLTVKPSGGEIVYDVGKTTAGFFVKGINYGLDFGKGVINPKKGEGRIKSGMENAYEGSFFSYCSEGQDIFIPIGAHVQMSFSDKNLK